jgi:hypothetical protein
MSKDKVMSNKMGRQPKRFGKPSEKFYIRKRAEEEAKAKIVPKTGSLALYLDDDRECPKGWILVRKAQDLYDLLSGPENVCERVTHLSIDWHLGAGEPTGTDVAKWFCERFTENPDYMPNLEMIVAHSSVREHAVRMIIDISNSLSDDRQDDIIFETETPKL